MSVGIDPGDTLIGVYTDYGKSHRRTLHTVDRISPAGNIIIQGASYGPAQVPGAKPTDRVPGLERVRRSSTHPDLPVYLRIPLPTDDLQAIQAELDAERAKADAFARKCQQIEDLRDRAERFFRDTSSTYGRLAVPRRTDYGDAALDALDAALTQLGYPAPGGQS